MKRTLIIIVMLAAVVIGCTVLFMGAAVIGYDPGRGLLARKGGD